MTHHRRVIRAEVGINECGYRSYPKSRRYSWSCSYRALRETYGSCVALVASLQGSEGLVIVEKTTANSGTLLYDVHANIKHYQPKRSSLCIFRYSVERYTWIFRFAITTNDANMACHFSEHCNSSMDYSYNLKQISADSWKTLVLRYALKKNIYGNTRASRDFEKRRLRFFPSLQYILRSHRSNR